MKFQTLLLLIFLTLFLERTLPIVMAGNFKIDLQNYTTIDSISASS
jgi:hypothetical protein